VRGPVAPLTSQTFEAVVFIKLRNRPRFPHWNWPIFCAFEPPLHPIPIPDDGRFRASRSPRRSTASASHGAWSAFGPLQRSRPLFIALRPQAPELAASGAFRKPKQIPGRIRRRAANAPRRALYWEAPYGRRPSRPRALRPVAGQPGHMAGVRDRHRRQTRCDRRYAKPANLGVEETLGCQASGPDPPSMTYLALGRWSARSAATGWDCCLFTDGAGAVLMTRGGPGPGSATTPPVVSCLWLRPTAHTHDLLAIPARMPGPLTPDGRVPSFVGPAGYGRGQGFVARRHRRRGNLRTSFHTITRLPCFALEDLGFFCAKGRGGLGALFVRRVRVLGARAGAASDPTPVEEACRTNPIPGMVRDLS